MGHGASCSRPSEEVDFFGAAQCGDTARLAAALRSRPTLLARTTLFDRLSALHIAAAHGHLQVRTPKRQRQLSISLNLAHLSPGLFPAWMLAHDFGVRLLNLLLFFFLLPSGGLPSIRSLRAPRRR
jgi:hypothetical protein